MTDVTDDVICYCSGTTKEKIKALIAQGITNLDMISRATGACSGCGSCDVEVKSLIISEQGANHQA